MEVDEMDSPKQQASKHTRVSSNGDKMDTSSIGDTSAVLNRMGVGGVGGEMVQSTRFGRQWQHSSRIIRVSRASGGKDRHSKVWTAKGPRDRRVRLSVTTAIQFYDLQDRLGYDQPSKAVEWLIRNASDAINDLPSLNACVFPPDTPRQLTDFDMDGNGAGGQQDHGQKSGCSSNNSETSKGSGLSLSRTESRVKARERARERTAKDKDKDKEKDVVEQVSNNRVTVASHQPGSSGNVRPMETSSFTQLLTAGINTNLSDNRGSSSTPSPHHHGGSAKNNNSLEWLNSSCGTTTTAAAATAAAPVANYFGNGLMGISSGSRPRNPIQLLGNATVLPHVMSLLPFATSHEMQQHHHHNQQQQQHFPFLVDQHQHQHLVQVLNNTTATSTGFGGSEYNLNFSMSPSSTTSGLGAGFNRGTLQSNSSSPSMLSYLQRFSNTDGSSVPFFLGGAPISPVVDNQHHHHSQHHHHHHHHHQQFDPAGLQLCYGDGSRHPDQKGKGKN